jgi:hypothetical protein
MSGAPITKALTTTDGRVLIEQPDGTYRPVESQTDWARLDAMTDHSSVPPAQGAGDYPARPRSVGLAQSPRTRLSDAYQCHFARVLRSSET